MVKKKADRKGQNSPIWLAYQKGVNGQNRPIEKGQNSPSNAYIKGLNAHNKVIDKDQNDQSRFYQKNLNGVNKPIKKK